MVDLTIGENGNIHSELIEGDPGHPYLVFLHEGLGCIAAFKEFPRRLCRATGCPGLVYDRLGYGRSSAREAAPAVDYLHKYACIELPRVIQGLIPNREYILVGHSDGGSIALIYASEKPALLRGIITEAAHVFVEAETLDGIRAADNAFERGELDGLYKYHGDKTRDTFKGWADMWLSKDFRDWNIEHLLPAIDCPLLVIQGDRDQYGTTRQVERIASQSCGPARPIIIPDCGHTPHADQPEIVLELMRGFIDKLQ